MPFEVVASDLLETLYPDVSPEDQAVALAGRKARAVASRFGDELVLGADTLVVLDCDILGKPRDDRHAARMVRRFNGPGFLQSVRLVVDEQIVREIDMVTVHFDIEELRCRVARMPFDAMQPHRAMLGTAAIDRADPGRGEDKRWRQRQNPIPNRQPPHRKTRNLDRRRLRIDRLPSLLGQERVPGRDKRGPAVEAEEQPFAQDRTRHLQHQIGLPAKAKHELTGFDLADRRRRAIGHRHPRARHEAAENHAVAIPARLAVGAGCSIRLVRGHASAVHARIHRAWPAVLAIRISGTAAGVRFVEAAIGEIVAGRVHAGWAVATPVRETAVGAAFTVALPHVAGASADLSLAQIGRAHV